MSSFACGKLHKCTGHDGEAQIAHTWQGEHYALARREAGIARDAEVGSGPASVIAASGMTPAVPAGQNGSQPARPPAPPKPPRRGRRRTGKLSKCASVVSVVGACVFAMATGASAVFLGDWWGLHHGPVSVQYVPGPGSGSARASPGHVRHAARAVPHRHKAHTAPDAGYGMDAQPESLRTSGAGHTGPAAPSAAGDYGWAAHRSTHAGSATPTGRPRHDPTPSASGHGRGTHPTGPPSPRPSPSRPAGSPTTGGGGQSASTGPGMGSPSGPGASSSPEPGGRPGTPGGPMVPGGPASGPAYNSPNGEPSHGGPGPGGPGNGQASAGPGSRAALADNQSGRGA